jgi:hypothetical protein
VRAARTLCPCSLRIQGRVRADRCPRHVSFARGDGLSAWQASVEKQGRRTQPRSTKPPSGLPQVSHSLTSSRLDLRPPSEATSLSALALAGYMSFQSSIRNAAMATSCPPQSDISVGWPFAGRGTIGTWRNRVNGEAGVVAIEAAESGSAIIGLRECKCR